MEHVDMPPVQTSSDPFTQQATDLLRRTKPWITFFAVLFFIGTGFLVLAGFLMAGLGAMGGMGNAFMGAMGGLAFGLIYLVLALLYLFFGYKLYAVSRAIRTFLEQPTSDQLMGFLDANRSMWKTFGVAVVVMLVFYLVAVILAIAIPVFLAS